jgi:hypothetical protein
MTENSPITGVIDEANVIVDFGKYEGRTVRELAYLDPALYGALANEKNEGMISIRRHRDKSFRLYLNPLAQLDQ